MTRNKANGSDIAITGLVVLTILCAGIWGYNIGHLDVPQNTDKGIETAQAICDYSHSVEVDSADWENACGMALDTIHKTYACDHSGTNCTVRERTSNVR